VAWSTGVTTWVDAGSSGAWTLEAFRSAVRGYGVRVPALLNISAAGLTAPTGEHVNLANCDVDLAIGALAGHRDLLAGVKVRVDRRTVGPHGLEPLRRGLSVAAACGVPLMAHIGVAPPSVADVVDLLRPGDIVTHCASGLADDSSAAMRAAYERGVVFDLGHGSGGFAFDVLETQLAAGLVPHAVSTDLHARSLYGPVFDLPTTMAKLLAVGMSLPEVVAAATVAPARVLGLRAGTLAVGAPADLAVFSVEEGRFELVDAHRQSRFSSTRLVNQATYVGGRLLPPRLPDPPRPWIPLTSGQRSALADREKSLRVLLGTPLVGAEALAEQFPRT
jgi:dihydroorotase